MQEKEDRTLNRRRLFRRAGTVAAGVAGASVVSAATAGPAHAEPHPFILETNNTEVAQTTLTNTTGNLAQNALRLENGTGAALSLQPLVTPSGGGTTPPSTLAPVGSVYADDWGDFYGIGQPSGQGEKYFNPLYSPTWATMVIPISPFRYMDTRTAAGRAFIVPGSASIDGTGRVLPRNSNTVPDLILDMTPFIVGGFAAVQANFTALLPVAQGFASLWDEGDWPGTSSINYAPALPEIANYTQTVIGPDGTIRLKTQRACQFIIDVVGFVLTNPFAQFAEAADARANGRRLVPERYTKRRPPSQ